MRTVAGAVLVVAVGACDRTIDWSTRGDNYQRPNCTEQCRERYDRCLTSEYLTAGMTGHDANVSRCAYEREACRADCGG